MLVFDDFDDPIGVGMPFLGVEGHDAGVPVGRVGQAVGRDLRDCGAGRVGNRLLRPDITPMPADLHDHAHHTDGGEQDASAYCTDGYRGDCNNQRQHAQPRHQRDDKRHVPFAVEIVGQHAQQHGQQDDGGGQPEHRGQKVCCCGTAGHAMLRAVEGGGWRMLCRAARPDPRFRFRLCVRVRHRYCRRSHARFRRFAAWLPFITFPFTIRNTALVRHLLPARFTVLLRAPVPHATMRTFLSHFLLRGMAALEQTTLMTCLRNGENTGMGE